MKDRNCEQCGRKIRLHDESPLVLCGHCQQVADLKAEVDRLRGVVRGFRGELVVVDMPDDLRYDPDKCAAWWKRYDAETERLCEGEKPKET